QLVKDIWFDLRGTMRESFLDHPAVRGIEAATRGLLGAIGDGAGSGNGGSGTGSGAGRGDGDRDALTPAATHAYFARRLDEEIARAKRHGRSLAVLKLDSDGFRAISEVHGAKAARELLRGLGAAILKNLREIDLCAR